jgi:hypothetical protein
VGKKGSAGVSTPRATMAVSIDSDNDTSIRGERLMRAWEQLGLPLSDLWSLLLTILHPSITLQN